MTYVTVSTWKSENPIEDQDAMWRVMEEKYAPASKAMGASSVSFVRVSDSETMIISTYPDKAASDAADAKRAELRSQGASEFSATMTSDVRGDVMVSA